MADELAVARPGAVGARRTPQPRGGRAGQPSLGRQSRRTATRSAPEPAAGTRVRTPFGRVDRRPRAVRVALGRRDAAHRVGADVHHGRVGAPRRRRPRAAARRGDGVVRRRRARTAQATAGNRGSLHGAVDRTRGDRLAGAPTRGLYRRDVDDGVVGDRVTRGLGGCIRARHRRGPARDPGRARDAPPLALELTVATLAGASWAFALGFSLVAGGVAFRAAGAPALTRSSGRSGVDDACHRDLVDRGRPRGDRHRADRHVRAGARTRIDRVDTHAGTVRVAAARLDTQRLHGPGHHHLRVGRRGAGRRGVEQRRPARDAGLGDHRRRNDRAARALAARGAGRRRPRPLASCSAFPAWYTDRSRH